MSIDRYETDDGPDSFEPFEKLDGRWVLYADHLARIAELEAEFARLRPIAELYPLAWEECKAWRQYEVDACDHACDPPVAPADAHDKARAERGVE
jgi:hypothetical protein